jgi:hypothetical protein
VLFMVFQEVWLGQVPSIVASASGSLADVSNIVLAFFLMLVQANMCIITSHQYQVALYRGGVL